MLQAWDALCAGCGNVHIIWVAQGEFEPREVLNGYAHSKGRTACGNVEKHRLVSRLDGVEPKEKTID